MNTPQAAPGPLYKPRWYQLTIAFNERVSGGGVEIGQAAQGSVTIQDVPFIFRRLNLGWLTAPKIDWTAAQFAGTDQAPDQHVSGHYLSFTLRTDSHVYAADQTLVIPATGSGYAPLELPSPVLLAPKATVTIEMVNIAHRLGPIAVQWVLGGVEPAEAFGVRP